MPKFHLDIIAGTAEFVQEEITAKFPDVKVAITSPTELVLQSNKSYNLNDFAKLRSAIRISNEDGGVRRIDRRPWRKAFVPAGVNPALAFILCQVAEVKSTDTVYDPFCGSGTIPITAVLDFGAEKAFASDVSGRAIDKTQENIRNAKVESKIVLFRSNISMVKLPRQSIDKIITNLPYGIRSKNHTENIKIYSALNNKAKSLLKQNGLMVILTQEKRLVYDIFGSDWNIWRIATVDVALRPDVFLLEPLGRAG